MRTEYRAIPCGEGGLHVMSRPFRSKLAPQFEEFILSRKAARRWSGSYEDNLHFFDNYCADSFPEQDVLIDEMLGWCRERPTENGNSCRYRITVVANFVRYANKKGWTDVMPPIVPSSCPCTYIPHAFSEKEIASLFEKVDAHVIKAIRHQKSKDKCLNALELPVYFRLLYSTGMRTNEARWLERSDVNLKDGIIDINRSKGLDQHRIALHPSMTDLLHRYDEKMAKMMPNRKHFFPNKNDQVHRPHWAEHHFRQVWREISGEPARIYDLRSHYAVHNVTRWKGLGYEIHQKLLYLSRSMGHRELSSTYGYFNLTPNLTDKIRSCCEDSFNSLLPNLPDYEQAKER